MGSIDDIKSILTQSALDALCEKFHISRIVHPELPSRNDRIRNSLTGKIDVYTRFFDFSNYRIPLSQFLVDILEYFQINLSQLFVIAAANVSPFEILCRVHDFVTTVGNFLCDFLATHPTPFQKFSESFLCLVGISRYYELDDNVYPVFLSDDDKDMDLFTFINHADPTKIRIGEKQIEEGQTPLIDSTRGRMVLLTDVNKQGNQNDNVQDVGHDVVVEEGAADGQENSVVADIVHIEDEVPAIVADKPKGTRKKRKTASGASNFLDSSTLAAEVGVTAAVTAPFVISFVTPTPERESDGRTDSISKLNLRTQHPAERFVIRATTSILTATIATTAIAGATSAPVHESGIEPVQRSIFKDSTSLIMTGADVVSHSQPAGAENVINDFALDNPKVCRSMVDQLAPPGERKKFERRCQRQGDLLKEKDTEIVNLKAQLSLKEAEAAEAIRLRSQVASIKGTEAARVNRLRSLKGQNATLKGQVAALESAALCCDELSIKAASLKYEKDKLTDQVSSLETTCSGLRDQVSGYELFKEQIEAVQDEQVKIFSDKVAELDYDLMGMALHMDEEFYPRFLTTIAGRRSNVKKVRPWNKAHGL
ncbi:hypothetical protein Tco_0478458 [Tanacetum coccineum]